MSCFNNQLSALDVSKNTGLTSLACNGNKLSALDVSKNTLLTKLHCDRNQIKGIKMLKLVNSMRTQTNSEFYAVYLNSRDEGNVITKAQVDIAKRKGWKVYNRNGNAPQEYAGSEPNDIAINEVNFPDPNFRNWLLAQGYGNDRKLTTEEIATVTSIDVENKQITDLIGLEHFTELERLNCSTNKLTTLNVSNHTALQTLNCNFNQLTELKLGNNIELMVLYCNYNKLAELEISKNTKLLWLNCYGNQLTTLDVSKNTELTDLYCSDNQLSKLNISTNTKLTKLQIFTNRIKDIEMATLVNSLPTVRNGDFKVINTKSTTEQNVILTSQVAIAKNKGWKVLDYCDNTNIEYTGYAGLAIDKANFPDEKFRNIVAARAIDKDQDGYLIPSEIAAVTSMDIRSKSIASLKGIGHFTELTRLVCLGNQLTQLDLSQNTKLSYLA